MNHLVVKKVAENSGKQFLVASIPVCKDENNNQINKVLPGLAKNVEDIAIKLDIKIIDLSGAFVDCSQYIRHRPNIMNSPSGVHFDENGYQLIAKALHKALQQLSY
jgi:lysophospholipase L1-like esterase